MLPNCSVLRDVSARSNGHYGGCHVYYQGVKLTLENKKAEGHRKEKRNGMADYTGSGTGSTIILVPVAFVWYLNIGGAVAGAKEARRRKAAAEEKTTAVTAQHRS